MNPQFNKGIVELCVLSLVNEQDRYGYELVDRISKRISISEGTIYPILRRLTQEKYFETYLRESTEGPPRKYYRITQAGRDVCRTSLEAWRDFSTQVSDLLGERAKEGKIHES